MKSAVKIITGWRKLVAPPVANSASATVGIVDAVMSARQPSAMLRPRAARCSSKTPQATAATASPSASVL